MANETTFTPPPAESAFAKAAAAAMDPTTPVVPEEAALQEQAPPPPAPKKEGNKPDLVPPPQAKADKAADKPSDESDMPPEIKSDEGRKNWRTWKEQHSKLEAEHASLKKEREEAEKALKAEIERLTREVGQRPDPKDFEAIKKEREEAQFKLKLKDVTEDPSWQKEIERPLADWLEKARTNAPRESRTQLERLLLQPPSDERNDAIEQLVVGLSPLKQTAIANAMIEIDKVNARKTALLSDHKRLVTEFETYTKREQEERKAAEYQAIENAAKSIISKLSDPQTGFGVLKGNKENAETAIRYATAELTPSDRATLAAWAVQGQKSQELLTAAADEIGKLKAQVAKLTSVTPGGGSQLSSQPKTEPTGFVEAVLQASGA